MFHVPNQHRLRTHPKLGSSDIAGNNGAFLFNHKGYEVLCIASDGMGWEHVSITIDRNRTPTWEMMAYIKNLFWDEEDIVIQIHPPKSQYINYHPNCLHLWRPIDKEIPLPDPIMIGPQERKN